MAKYKGGFAGAVLTYERMHFAGRKRRWCGSHVKTIKRTQITVETHRAIWLSGSTRPIGAWCAECGGHAHMVTADEAAIIVGKNTRTIYRWVEARMVHFTETREGVLSICVNSLCPGQLIPD